MSAGPINSSIINVHPMKILFIVMASIFCILPFIGIIPIGYILAYEIACLIGMAIAIDAWSYSTFCARIKQAEQSHGLLQRWPYAPKDLIEDTSAELDYLRSIRAYDKVLRATMTLWAVNLYQTFRGQKLYVRMRTWEAVILNNEANTLGGNSKARYGQNYGTMDIDMEKGSST